MISHKYKCIFIHIPKCAGTSIERALGHHDFFERGMQDHRTLRQIKPQTNLDIISRSRQINFHRKKILQKLGYKKNRNINNSHTVTASQYRNYFKFSFVRNPWDRCFSWYRNVIRDPAHRARYDISSEVSFNDFLQANIGKRNLRSQLHWIENNDQEIELDFIGRFENLERDFAYACDMIGANVILPHILNGGIHDYRHAYDSALKNLVFEVFGREIALFGYSFDG